MSVEEGQNAWRTGFRADSGHRGRWTPGGEAYLHRAEETIDLPTPNAIELLMEYEGAHVLVRNCRDWLGWEATLNSYVEFQHIGFSRSPWRPNAGT